MPHTRDVFSSVHPALNMAYFTAAIGFSMFFLHPVLSALSLAAGIGYMLLLRGKKALRFCLWMLPAALVAAVINPLFNHRGVHILFLLPDGNAVTLESVIYGASSSLMLVTVFVWFSCFNAVMTGDKLMHLTGRVMPRLSLMFSMALRLVPRLRAQAAVISGAQRTLGRDVTQGRIPARIKNSGRVLYTLITWALENSIETAASMRARGYGLSGRTRFSPFKPDKRDGVLAVLLLCCTAAVITGTARGRTAVTFFPALSLPLFTPAAALSLGAYALLIFLPLILNLWPKRGR